MSDIDSNLPTKDTADGTIGSTSPTVAQQVGGTDGTNLRAISVDTTGKLISKAQLQDNSGTAIILGQNVMASSLPVTLSSNQSNISVITSDISPSNGSITALDSATISLVGANGQVFYTGTPTANSSAVFSLSSIGTIDIQLNLIGAGGTIVVEVSMDGGSFWFRPNVYQVSTQSYTNGFTAPFMATVNVTGMTHIRARSTVSWTGTGTIIVKESVRSRSITIGDALPTGANIIGAVTQSGTWNINNVSGTVSLPTGAATSSLQTTGNTTLSTIESDLTNGNNKVQGNSPSGSSDSGNPVKVGGIFNTSLPILTTGQRGDLQLDASARTIISPLTNTSVVKAQLQDDSGNGITSILNGSERYLHTASIQDVNLSVSNNSTSNLTAGATFTGTGETSLGIAGIQVNFKSTQNCTIQVQQSIDNSNWDISDSFIVLANTGTSRTFQATASFLRVLVTNNGASTTTFLRLQTALCPIIETIPRSLSASGNLKVENQAPTFTYYSAPVNIRQTAATAANSTVWAIRNAVASTLSVYVETIYLLMSFDTATPITRSLQRYQIQRFSTATPTGGTSISIAAMDSADPATNVTDARFLDTGLTTTSVVFDNPIAIIGCPATDATTTQYTRVNVGIRLAPGEGLCIRLTVAAVVGQGLTGEVVWSER